MGIPLSRHIIEQEHLHPGATGEFSILLHQLSYAGRVLADAIGRAQIAGIAGAAGTTGPTGDTQQRLDILADEIIRDAFASSRLVAGIASEEHEDPAEVSIAPEANYLLGIDPIDGSGNVAINAELGTIFGIFRRRTDAAGPVDPAEFLRPGRELVAAGYLLYGPATMLVYTAGAGVFGFTLDRSVGEFVLTHPGIECPPAGPVLAMNTARLREWSQPVRSFVAARQGRSMVRYSGSPVADVHRCLLHGGAFVYPPDADYPTGKLRTVYEAAPMAFLVEHAGGAASTGAQAVVDITPGSLHDTTPIAIGSTDLIADYLEALTSR